MFICDFLLLGFITISPLKGAYLLNLNSINSWLWRLLLWWKSYVDESKVFFEIQNCFFKTFSGNITKHLAGNTIIIGDFCKSCVYFENCVGQASSFWMFCVMIIVHMHRHYSVQCYKREKKKIQDFSNREN